MPDTSHDTVESKMNDEEAAGCPVVHGRIAPPDRGRRQRALVARATEPPDPAQAPRRRQPHGRRLRLRRRVRDRRPRRAARRRRAGHDDLAGLVARRLRPLRRFFIRMAWHSAGTYRIARRPRRLRRGHAALRPAQQLARQRQPRQGPPPALAGQAEVRQAPLLGRPDGLHRQLRAGVHGPARPSASPAAAPTRGSPTRTSTGARRPSGSATSATPATASSRARSPPRRWA